MSKMREFSLKEKRNLLLDYVLPKMSKEAVSKPFLNELLKKRDEVETATLHNADLHQKQNRQEKDPAVEKILKNLFPVMRKKDAQNYSQTTPK